MGDPREEIGRGTALWAPERHAGPGCWSAFSGVDAVDYNVVCRHGAAGAQDVAGAIDEIRAAGVRGVVMLAGEARASSSALEGAGWRWLGTTPLMSRAIDDPDFDPAAEVLGPGDLGEARGLIVTAFGLAPELGPVALPDDAVTREDRFVVGLRDAGRLAGVFAGVLAGESVVGWSMATDPARLRQGIGRRTLASMLAEAARRGATRSLHIASPDGAALYAAAGYVVEEEWEIWTRPRWAFGRL